MQRVAAADEYCQHLVRHYENFTVASRLSPRALRRDLVRIYAFCRTTDDLGDESGDTELALRRLAEWRHDVEALFDGAAPVHPVLLALASTLRRIAFDRQPFLDLIDANMQDQRVNSYEDWDALIGYCRLSAAPVGRMVLTLFGIADARAVALSDDVCIGLQLANFAQDVSVDSRRGRTYLLQSHLRAGGALHATRSMCERAHELLQSGRQLEVLAPLRLRAQLSLYRLGGEAILDAIAAAGYDTQARRPVVTRSSRVSIAVRALRSLAPHVGRRRDARAARVPQPAAPQTSESTGKNGRRGLSEALARVAPPARPVTPLNELAPAIDMRASERFCEEMARREAANFYWGFIALPKAQRTAIYALYDFARQVDDDADLNGASSRRERLEFHRHRLHHARPGDTTDPVISVLAMAMAHYEIPTSEVEMLIDGVEMDLTTNRYQTWDELRGYCTLVASVIGRMCVRIFGFRDAAALQRADELGQALQLINILRDVREDAGRGRIYLPLDELDRFGISESEVLSGSANGSWPDLVRFEAARAREQYATGLRVTQYIPRQSAVCVRTMAGIYAGILQRIESDPYLPLRRRASLSAAAKVKVMARAWLSAV